MKYHHQKPRSTLIYLLVLVFLASAMVGAFVNVSSGRGEAAIYGHVKDKDTEEPISEAKVTISDHKNESYTVYTNRDGYYEQAVDGGKNYSVKAEREGYESQGSGAYVEDGEEKKVDFYLEKKSDKTILKGHTKEKDSGEAISGVSIKIAKENFSKTTTSGDEGYYEFELEEGGKYTLRAEKDGYKDYEAEVEVAEGEENVHHIHMEKDGGGEYSEIFGHVKDKETGDALPETKITITDNREETYTVYTNRDGDYHQEVDGKKNYTVKAERDGYKSQTKHVYVESGETRVDFALEKDGGGDKTILKGHTKEKDSGEAIAHVDIRVWHGNYSESGRSDDKGYYEMELEHGGEYDVRAEKDGYKDYEGEVYVKEGDETIHNIHMEKDGGGEESWIFGHVKDAETEEAIVEAKVTISDDRNETYTTYTNKDGYYQQEVEGNKNYTVKAERDGYKSQMKHAYVEKGDETRVDFYLEKEGGEKSSIYGYVKDKETEEAIVEARITITEHENESYTTYTDRDGYYHQEVNGDGYYTITAERDGYESQTEKAWVKEGEERQVDFYLEKEGGGEKTILKGHTKEKDSGESIVGAEVTIKKGEFSKSTTSGEGGYYEFELEHGGNYTVVAEKDGYKRYEEHVYVEEGKETIHNIHMEREGGGEKTVIYGHVKDKETEDPLHAEITIKGDSNHTYTTETDREGYYEQQLEHGGEYTVIAEAEGYHTEDERVYVEKGDEKQVDFNLEKKGGEKTILKGHTKEKDSGEHVAHADVIIKKGEFHANTTSNKEGYYEFTLEEGGEYTIVAEKEGYERYEEEVYVEEGKENTHNIPLKKKAGETSWIFGHVKDKDTEEPIKHAEITIKKGDVKYTTYTNDDGYYVQELEEGGVYAVIAEKEGYNSEDAEVYVEDGNEERQDFFLEREYKGKRLFGFIKHLGHAVKGAIVKLIGNNCNCSFTAESGEEGGYEINNIPAGEYTMVVEKDGYQRFEETVVIPEEGDGKEFNVELTSEEEPGKPDLAVESFSLPETFAPIQEGDVVPLSAEIVNNGDETAESVAVSFYDNADGMLTVIVTIDTVEIERLAPGETVTVEAEWDTTGQAGVNTLWVTVDPDDEIEESDETNNEEDLTIEIAEKGEGGVRLYAETTKFYIENSTLSSLSVTIENTGDYADSYSLSVKSLDSGWSVDFGDAYTVSLDAGDSRTFTVTVTRGAEENVSGSMRFEIHAQSTTDPTVFDSLSIKIETGGDGDDGGGLPGFDAPIAVASVSVGALVAFFLGGRRH